jgi:hypothetical protein
VEIGCCDVHWNEFESNDSINLFMTGKWLHFQIVYTFYRNILRL